MKVAPNDADYRKRAAAEEAFWEHPPLTSVALEASHSGAFERFINQSYTGDPAVTWMEDLIRRGPFETAAALGSMQGRREASWLSQGGSRRLDVYDISAKVLARARSQLGIRWFESRRPTSPVRFFRVDLNFVELPREAYDVIWTTGCVHHVTNLEYLFQEIEAALRPGGIFAIHDYVGESRFRYAPERLALAEAVFQRIPSAFRRADHLEPLPAEDMSPFEAIRSGETLELLRARFDTVHLMQADALYPLGLLVDFAGLEREEPALLAEIFAAEMAARHDPSMRKCSLYGVFRKR